MPTRIRLQRKGKKGSPYYHIVVADKRAPRDGKYIERIGAYNPTLAPALVEVDRDRAIYWLQHGAQPSDTARAILNYSGVLYKNHLLNGVKKGAFDQEEADRRFDSWLKEKEEKIEAKRQGLVEQKTRAYQERVALEKKTSDDRADALAAKLAASIPAAPAAEEKAQPAEAAQGEAPAEPAEAALAEAPAEPAEPAQAEAPAETKATPAEPAQAEAAAEEAPQAEEPAQADEPEAGAEEENKQ